MSERAVRFLESSFLKDILLIPGVTDVSYNGESFFYEANEEGRRKADLRQDEGDVAAFLRQIANLTERQFSYRSPILDVSFSRYRLNAVFPSLSRSHDAKTCSFSLRIGSDRDILEGDGDFFGGSKPFLLTALKEGENIVIGGPTSSGKTELEKWLLRRMEGNKRVIVIDNLEELGMVSNPNIDLTTWLVNDSLPMATFPSLVKNALRSDPDYIVIAEARGGEMLEGILSALSGHAIITTIHAKSLLEMPERMARLAMMGDRRLSETELSDDVHRLFRYFAFLGKRQRDDGKVERRVEEIGRTNPRTGEIEVVFQRRGK